jgi:hypothetical protein
MKAIDYLNSLDNFPENQLLFKSREELAVLLDAYLEWRGISCQCKNEDKHGETGIMCCNECGLPTEDFWKKG